MTPVSGLLRNNDAQYRAGPKARLAARKLLVRCAGLLRPRHGITMPHNPAAWQDLRDRGFERISKLSRGRQAALDYPCAPDLLSAFRQRQGIAAKALEVTLLSGHTYRRGDRRPLERD